MSRRSARDPVVGRRDVLRGAAALVGGAMLGGTPAVAGPRREPSSGGTFTSGVLAGDARQHAVTLMARVAGLGVDDRVGVEVARDPGFAHVIARRLVSIAAAPGDMARARIVSPQLRPGDEYWYRFFTGTADSPVGRFRTRRPGDSAETVRFAYFSCQGWQAGYYTAQAGLAAEPDLDLVLDLGDYIYELTDDTGPPERVDPTGADHDGFAQTLDEYRDKYRLYQSDPQLQQMHAAHGILGVWDNHELADDSPGHLQGRPIRVPLAQRMANGKQAFWESLPMERAREDATGLYRSVRLGRHVELILLDTHTYADPPGQGGSYLGARQLAWLRHRLVHSAATWKIIASTTVMMGTDLTPGHPLNLGQWDGYPEERRILMQTILDAGVRGVIVLSGDLHTMIAGQVTTTGRTDGTAAAVDFTSGAITSNGLIEMFHADPGLAPALEAQGLAVNRHIAFLDVLAKGYGIVEADARELRVTYRSPASVLVPESPMRDRVRFRVVLDAPAVEILDTPTPAA